MAGKDKIAQTSDRAEVKRQAIVRAARELVIEHGYAGVSTEQVLERAGVSRGGLYHHFSGKQELMAAVLEAVEVDFTERLVRAVADAPDPFTALQTGTQWYLDECLRSQEIQRIGLYEGRQALGWTTWRETISPYCLKMLAAGLDAAIEAGQLERADPNALAHLILALLHEAATMIVTAPNPLAERARIGAPVATVIVGLQKR
jgi:AcrR family transcriptional regulator